MGKLTREVATIEEALGAVQWVSEMIRRGLPAGPVVVTLGRLKRSLDQNAKLWAMLTDVSRDVEWYGRHLTPEEWKDVFTAALKKQSVVPGIDGGFVVLGAHTSRMDKAELGALLDLIDAFGSEHGVKWSDPNG